MPCVQVSVLPMILTNYYLLSCYMIDFIISYGLWFVHFGVHAVLFFLIILILISIILAISSYNFGHDKTERKKNIYTCIHKMETPSLAGYLDNRSSNPHSIEFPISRVLQNGSK